MSKRLAHSFDSARPKVHYENLELSPDLATKKRIKESYNRLALRWHPDRNPDPVAADKFAAISASYRLLADTQLRREYDKWIRENHSSGNDNYMKYNNDHGDNDNLVNKTWMRRTDYSDLRAQTYSNTMRRKPRYGMDSNRKVSIYTHM